MAEGSRPVNSPVWEILQGDVLEQLKRMEVESVHTCVTSPPYWGLRDYSLPPTIWDEEPGCEHQWGVKRPALNSCTLCGAWRGTLGLEPTPDLYVRHLVEIFREVWRVLRPDGTVWLNLGDSYAGSGGAHTHSQANPGVSNSAARNGVPKYKAEDSRGMSRGGQGIKAKDVVGIPWMTAFALRGDGWWLRRPIIWHKPNPMPESANDRPTAAHEDIFLLAKSGSSLFWTHRDGPGTRRKPQADYRWIHRETGEEREGAPDGWHTKRACAEGKDGCAVCKAWSRRNLWTGHDYFYDGDAVRMPLSYLDKRAESGGMVRSVTDTENPHYGQAKKTDKLRGHSRRHAGFNDRWDGMSKEEQEAGGANLRDVWTIATQPFSGAHFATFPHEIPRRCILLGTSEHGVCGACGAPRSRGTEKSLVPTYKAAKTFVIDDRDLHADKNDQGSNRQRDGHKSGYVTAVKTIGWRPTCECRTLKVAPAVVLDPFAGSGTTGLVALRNGRSFVGIELSPQYAEMARNRIIGDAPLLNTGRLL